MRRGRDRARDVSTYISFLLLHLIVVGRVAYCALNQNSWLKVEWISCVGSSDELYVWRPRASDSFAKEQKTNTTRDEREKAKQIPSWFIYDYFSNEKWHSPSSRIPFRCASKMNSCISDHGKMMACNDAERRQITLPQAICVIGRRPHQCVAATMCTFVGICLLWKYHFNAKCNLNVYF